MSSVLETLKLTSRALTLALIRSNARCKVLTFVLYEMDAADNAKLST